MFDKKASSRHCQLTCKNIACATLFCLEHHNIRWYLEPQLHGDDRGRRNCVGERRGGKDIPYCTFVYTNPSVHALCTYLWSDCSFDRSKGLPPLQLKWEINYISKVVVFSVKNDLCVGLDLTRLPSRVTNGQDFDIDVFVYQRV
ncbi:tubulin alpha chain [Echinococcus multilocularis]|uniref:Tubulin alpha chain n=1 Tax=Echinococcus multilocularis TaxID=6211 RepID=A0A0S4MM76_ECHMU|nr:tubulin alpha chain [Echinococcus multilocularis]